LIAVHAHQWLWFLHFAVRALGDALLAVDVVEYPMNVED
jgi:hypothetical protein